MNPQRRRRSMEGEEAVSSLDIGKDRRIDRQVLEKKDVEGGELKYEHSSHYS